MAAAVRKVRAVVKADAYGLGVEPVAQTARADAWLPPASWVATLDEAVALRQILRAALRGYDQHCAGRARLSRTGRKRRRCNIA